MYDVGAFVVCPGHGVGQISDIQKREIAGETHSFYNIKIMANGMKIMIPAGSEGTAMRVLVGDTEIEDVFTLLKNHDVEVDNSTWNRRYREYMNKVKTGSLLEIADVLRSLLLLKNSKNLSFGEKKMLDQCKDLLVKEIALSKGDEEQEISSRIDSCFH